MGTPSALRTVARAEEEKAGRKQAGISTHSFLLLPIFGKRGRSLRGPRGMELVMLPSAQRFEVGGG